MSNTCIPLPKPLSLEKQLLIAQAAIAELKGFVDTDPNWEGIPRSVANRMSDILESIDLSALDKHDAEVRKPLVDALIECKRVIACDRPYHWVVNHVDGLIADAKKP